MCSTYERIWHRTSGRAHRRAGHRRLRFLAGLVGWNRIGQSKDASSLDAVDSRGRCRLCLLLSGERTDVERLSTVAKGSWLAQRSDAVFVAALRSPQIGLFGDRIVAGAGRDAAVRKLALSSEGRLVRELNAIVSVGQGQVDVWTGQLRGDRRWRAPNIPATKVGNSIEIRRGVCGAAAERRALDLLAGTMDMCRARSVKESLDVRRRGGSSQASLVIARGFLQRFDGFGRSGRDELVGEVR